MPATASRAATKCISEVPGLAKHTSTPQLTSVCASERAPFSSSFIDFVPARNGGARGERALDRGAQRFREQADVAGDERDVVAGQHDRLDVLREAPQPRSRRGSRPAAVRTSTRRCANRPPA